MTGSYFTLVSGPIWLTALFIISLIPLIAVLLQSLLSAFEGDVNYLKPNEKLAKYRPSVNLFGSTLVNISIVYLFFGTIPVFEYTLQRLVGQYGFDAFWTGLHFRLFALVAAVLVGRALFVTVEFERGTFYGARDVPSAVKNTPVFQWLEFVIRLAILIALTFVVAGFFPAFVTGGDNELQPLIENCWKLRDVTGSSYNEFPHYQCLRDEIAALQIAPSDLKAEAATIEGILASYRSDLRPLFWLYLLMTAWSVSLFMWFKGHARSLRLEGVAEYQIAEKWATRLLWQASVPLLGLLSVLLMTSWIEVATRQERPWLAELLNMGDHSLAGQLVGISTLGITLGVFTLSFMIFRVIQDLPTLLDAIREVFTGVAREGMTNSEATNASAVEGSV